MTLARETFDFRDETAVRDLAVVWRDMGVALTWAESAGSDAPRGYLADPLLPRSILETQFRLELARLYEQHPNSQWTKDKANRMVAIKPRIKFPKTFSETRLTGPKPPPRRTLETLNIALQLDHEKRSFGSRSKADQRDLDARWDALLN
jgi:hypothetical protein